MSGNRVDVLTVGRIREELVNFLSVPLAQLNEYKVEVQKHMVAMENKVHNFMISGNLPTDVWQYIQENKEKVKMSDVLDRVHTSIYPTQNLIDVLQINHYDVLNLIINDSTTLYETASLSVQNHPIFDRVVMSNAERTREAKFALLACKSVFDFVVSRCKRAKLFSEWASKQLDLLNRIDSMIRLKQRIGEQSFYESLVAQSTLSL